MKAKAGADTEFKATGKRKKAGSPGKPKRGLTPFFVFLAEFRPQYLEKHPEAKGVAAVTKAAGVKWRAMSDEEKAQYGGNKKQDDKASKPANKKESTSSKKAKTDGEEEGEGSDKSKSEVEDDDEKDDNEDEDEE
ncbi:DNA-binding protein MNB1B-like [Phragmites australis]|uniref:DNA-binding protein MNB1B-like n=1 Tax=Phragmites australis TaxID=29695 RepID=UPI002D796469|nr:DNA-binding protein MNB1B-like [Phragmites australis]